MDILVDVKNRVGQMVKNTKELPVIVLILALMLYLGINAPNFFSAYNIVALLTSMTSTMIVAIGMSLLLIIGCIDLSVGSVLAASGAVCGLMLLQGIPVIICVIAGILVGVIFGLINGILVTKGGMHPFIVTLGTMSIGRGMAFVLLKGYGISGFPEEFNRLGQGSFLGLEYPVWVMFILMLIAFVILRFFRMSKTLYYIGGNEMNAKLLGIKVDRVKLWMFVISGFLAAVAGILVAARFGGASNQAGTGLELQAIIACIIGGISLFGGEGGILGSYLGVFLLLQLQNSFNLLRVSIYWRDFTYGIILMIAVILNVLRIRGKEIQRL